MIETRVRRLSTSALIEELREQASETTDKDEALELHERAEVLELLAVVAKQSVELSELVDMLVRREPKSNA